MTSEDELRDIGIFELLPTTLPQRTGDLVLDKFMRRRGPPRSGNPLRIGLACLFSRSKKQPELHSHLSSKTSKLTMSFFSSLHNNLQIKIKHWTIETYFFLKAISKQNHTRFPISTSFKVASPKFSFHTTNFYYWLY